MNYNYKKHSEMKFLSWNLAALSAQIGCMVPSRSMLQLKV